MRTSGLINAFDEPDGRPPFQLPECNAGRRDELPDPFPIHAANPGVTCCARTDMASVSRALVRTPSAEYVSFYARRGIAIAPELLHQQHAGYVRALEAAGAGAEVVESAAEYPDGVFVEDTAVVWRGRALIASMALHRDGEQAAVETVLRRTHEIVRLPPGATLDGGDVLHTESTTYVGASSRTNTAGVQAVAALLAPSGRPVVEVPVRRCLHLKTAVTYLGGGVILAAPALVDLDHFKACDVIQTAAGEEHAANSLRLNDDLLVLAGYPETQQRLATFARGRGLRLNALPMSEFEKGDGSLTSLSILW